MQHDLAVASSNADGTYVAQCLCGWQSRAQPRVQAALDALHGHGAHEHDAPNVEPSLL